MPYVCVSESGQHWFRYWLVAYSAPSPYLNECSRIVNWTLRNRLKWNLNQNTKSSIHGNASEKKGSSANWWPFVLEELSYCFLNNAYGHGHVIYLWATILIKGQCFYYIPLKPLYYSRAGNVSALHKHTLDSLTSLRHWREPLFPAPEKSNRVSVAGYQCKRTDWTRVIASVKSLSPVWSQGSDWINSQYQH